ncbi:NADP-dependent oxidoreductase domain-containing protein [Cokeromyces recurvatus]|uniref:NADP-dependent oxidoreductase domain-containing protein n=1 Tax=Cokeromyces recurvatus TaxID=90255 RepID=UPI00221F7080|nr:NADP-dependent oxidoreductase domain-containing protein [Cokeromyces recurvatus]KAI7908264.1 NADP-dependent oxidoreductase domain-containing protein [Cokeromyces recurvatus]
MALNRKITLNTGNEVPVIGLGTWLSKPDEVRKAVKCALETGYRHLDCAYVYCNEDEVGQGIRESGVPRKEIFITSKLWNTHHRKEYVKAAVKASLKALGLDYLDLYLIHWPVSFINSGKPEETPVVPNMEYLIPKKNDIVQLEEVDPLETWNAMEELVEEGYVKAIGLSNFNIEKTQYILDHCKIKPAMNQIELHPALQQPELVSFLHKNNIQVTAYSPLGNNVYGEKRIVDDPIILDIAKKLNKSPAQICIAFAAQRGLIVIPKSVTPSRIVENFQDFELSKEDFDSIASLGSRNIRYNDPGLKDWNCTIF